MGMLRVVFPLKELDRVGSDLQDRANYVRDVLAAKSPELATERTILDTLRALFPSLRIPVDDRPQGAEVLAVYIEEPRPAKVSPAANFEQEVRV